MKRYVTTEHAPKAIGPYSQARNTGQLIFLSGQIGIDPKTGRLVDGGIREQTGQIMRNITAILESCGLTMQDVVRSEVFLTDLSMFQEFNTIYGTWFTDGNYPARFTVGVAALPMQALVEIACIAAHR
jgi:2-iminobutanoate/2-iminopropanoate deaminase